jgi:hypothetical protein
VSPSTLTHEALFYEDTSDYVELITCFALEGLDADEPVLIAVPEPRLDVLRHVLGGAVTFVDMREEGRNPGRIIPLLRSFLDEHPGRGARCVAEPAWPERTPAETIETHRHEALMNAAFRGEDVHIVCPYGTSELDSIVIEDATRTHPTVVSAGGRHASRCYVDPMLVYAASESPLPEPFADPVQIDLDGLASFRHEVESLAPAALGGRVSDLVIAANEAAVNTLVHGDGGTARLWCEGDDIVVEVRDRGVIEDPLAGQRLPDPLQESGRGLWLMHQLCDLVEVRSGVDGTVVRLHMALSRS